MKPNKVTRAVIKSALEKGIRDIQENPQRGIRNLVDLGEMFSRGRNQKDFFLLAQQELSNQSSAYYRLVERIVRHTDAEVLTNFGINLGYNSWTSGAGRIREVEEKEGFCVPWCVLFRMASGCEVSIDTVSRIIAEGKKLGIYCYMFAFAEPYDRMDALLQLMNRESDCAFVVFLHPDMVDSSLAGAVRKLATVWPVIRMDCGEDSVRKAVGLMRENRCLYAGYVRSGDLTKGAQWIHRADALDVPVLMFAGTEPASPETTDPARYDEIVRLRRQLAEPVLPVHLTADTVHINSNISSVACMLHVSEEADAVAVSAGRVIHTGENVNRTPLRDILSRNLPGISQAGQRTVR